MYDIITTTVVISSERTKHTMFELAMEHYNLDPAVLAYCNVLKGMP